MAGKEDDVREQELRNLLTRSEPGVADLIDLYEKVEMAYFGALTSQKERIEVSDSAN